MGTSGLFGLRKNGKDKVVYSHFDSYPDGLGREFLTFVKLNENKLSTFFDHLVEINPKEEPTKEQIAYCKEMGWYNSSVSERSDKDWYCLLHGCQSLKAWQTCLDTDKDLYIDNYIDFITESLFCEYAYIYDVDTGLFEVYVGFQHEPDENNRYGTINNNGYYPCKLLGTLRVKKCDNITKTIEHIKELEK